MNGTKRILLEKYNPEALQEEQSEMAVLPRLKPYQPGPIITKETQAKLDILKAEQQKVENLKAEQAETKRKLDAVGSEIKKLKTKLGIGKRDPAAEWAYQSNLAMFRRLGVLA